ncbi:hypothetical protein MNV49_001913 [Pseudohyphozyma bogoriensis]|nr:hypothetical protein MNV49_001913 [Pseudohyphozyma bogoriensis]
MSISSFFSESIASPTPSPSWMEATLLLMTFSTSMVDTMTVPTMHIFVANNTGNLLLLGLGAAGLHKNYPDLVYPDRAGVALVGSWVGSFVTGLLKTRFGARRRAFLIGEFSFEGILILVCAILLYTNAVDLTQGSKLLAIIALLGYSYGAQSVSTKALGMPTIMVQVVTGAMADLLADPKLFVPLMENKARNQRALFILTFFVGAVLGGLILVRYTVWPGMAQSGILPSTCVTGGCNGGLVCADVGGTGVPPATLAELTLSAGTGVNQVDYYDISIVDGMNVPVDMTNSAQEANDCNPCICSTDLNPTCPSALAYAFFKAGCTDGYVYA